MKKYILPLFFLILLAKTAYGQNDSLTIVNSDWNWKKIHAGMERGYLQTKIFDSEQSISIIKFKINRFKVKMADFQTLMANRTDSLAMRKKALAAINGSYFNVKTLTPVTFFSMRHKVLGHTDSTERFRCTGAIGLKCRNGRKIDIFPYESEKEREYSRRYHSVLASGPILLDEGEVMTFISEPYFYDKRHPRSIIGTDNDGYCYLIVIDGRFPGKAEGMTVPEMALLCKYFGLKDAMNLDGGGSSTLWSKEAGILNHPYDNKKFDHEGARKVPNIIYVK